MSLNQLISSDITVLTPEDTGDKALDIMDEQNGTQLPVVADDAYVGLVQENELLEWAKPGDALSTSGLLGFKPAIISSAHPFEALKLMSQMHLHILPVVDGDAKYLGVITQESLLRYVTETSGIDTPGGIIVLEVPPRNYTLYEIARICENEDVVIMNTQVHANEQGNLEVTLKLNRTALDAVVSSLERHKYQVKEVYGEDHYDEDIESKYHLLMNYINM